MILHACARVAWYSGRYRPAWRMSQIGGGQTGSPANARSRGFAVLSMPIA
jgi:hypothetical protein